ncbi:MAG TPA: glycosyltransferase [Thermomicrobiales bacterium]|nr:glycosyltransferase [Thermomicrobiales bacterium]
MTRQPRICYAGTYERGYPRNRLAIDALRQAGMRVEEAHVPVFERWRDKSRVAPLALPGLALRLALAWLRLVPEVALRLLRCDALLIGYIGQADMLALAPVAKAMGRPVIFNPLVTLTDTLVEDRAVLSTRSLAARAIARIDRASLRLADQVLVDTRQNAAYVIDAFGVASSRVYVLPVGADERVFYAGAAERDSSTLDVLFYGKFIPLHGADTIVEAAALLEGRGVEARFELVGTGQTHARARELAASLGVASLTWTDWLPEAELGERLRRADVALGVFGAGAKAGRVIPNKVYQSLACRVATITRDSDAARDLLLDGDSALLVPPGDPAALADAIERLADPELRARVAQRGHAVYRERASADALACRIGQIASQWRLRA